MTDCEIEEPWLYCPVWWSHKSNGPGLKYELAISIFGGDIVAVHGPFPCAISDRECFDVMLSAKLFTGEKVEADSGYTGRDQIVTPKVAPSRYHQKQKSQVRGRHENVNGRIKRFKAVSSKFRNNLEKHGDVFRAVAVIVQLSFDHGLRLYDVEYDATYD